MSHQFCVCACCSLSLSCRRSNMRLWPNVGLLLAHRLRRWANISPVLGVVFDVTPNVGQRHRRQANINPSFVQSIVRVLQPAWSRPTDYGWMNTSQHRSPANTRRWTSAGFMLGQRRRWWARIGPALGQRWDKDDLVTVDHLPGSKSWHSEVSGVANLAVEDSVDIKNGFHHIKIHSLYLSTVQRSYLVTLITKAINTTSNSYQPLWLRCWRETYPVFFTKKLDSSS